jgi:hypothetical protein
VDHGTYWSFRRNSAKGRIHRKQLVQIYDATADVDGHTKVFKQEVETKCSERSKQLYLMKQRDTVLSSC